MTGDTGKAEFFSPEEQAHAVILFFNILRLHQLAHSYRAAVALFQFAQQEETRLSSLEAGGGREAVARTIGEWRSIAARDAAFTVYHFHKTLGAISAASRKLTSIQSFVDQEKRRLAWRVFNKHFPDPKGIRDAIGHLAELTESVEKFRINAVGSRFTFGAIQGERLVVSHNGEIRSLEISKTNAEKISDVANLVDSAFGPIGLPEKLKLVPVQLVGDPRAI